MIQFRDYDDYDDYESVRKNDFLRTDYCLSNASVSLIPPFQYIDKIKIAPYRFILALANRLHRFICPLSVTK